MSDDKPLEALTAFLCVLTTDGGLDVYTHSLPSVTIKRQAQMTDIEAASQRLAAEAGRQLIIEALNDDTDVSPAQVVSEALARRGDS